jgi:hypothetical protein
MKALLVVEDDDLAEMVRCNVQPLGLDIIHYRDPIKALDNLDEIAPDAVIMSARDYPRHWKTIVVDIRAARPKAACAIILLKGEYFPFEEAAKAAYLGVNGVIKENISEPAELDRFVQILKRYIQIDDARVSDRHAPGPTDRFGFVFSHPETYLTITGVIETISSDGVSFFPESRALVADLEPGCVIDDASLRVDTSILSFRCKLVRNEVIMAFVFECDEDQRQVLAEYISGRSEREMRALLKH